MMARGTAADVVVIALVGERGREVRSFLEHDLGADGLKRSVVVVSTSDNPPLVRLRAAYVAHGDRRVLPRPGQERAADDGLGDALRDGAARGRPGGRRAADGQGLPAVGLRACCPACSSARATCAGRGSITAFYTVLVEGDDINEPIADDVRAILDGHIVLSRDAGGAQPLSRHRHARERQPHHARRDRAVAPAQGRPGCATGSRSRARTRTSVSVGAYVAGTSARIDEALARRDAVDAFLQQPADSLVEYDGAVQALEAL